jgi:hypothetical protein
MESEHPVSTKLRLVLSFDSTLFRARHFAVLTAGTPVPHYVSLIYTYGLHRGPRASRPPCGGLDPPASLVRLLFPSPVLHAPSLIPTRGFTIAIGNTLHTPAVVFIRFVSLDPTPLYPCVGRYIMIYMPRIARLIDIDK